MISIENLCFSYSDRGPTIFHQLDLILGDVPRTCILGAEGAGKTTLAKLLKGLLTPQAGRITYSDGNVLSTTAIGYVAADPDDNLVGITVDDDIIFGLENLGLPASEVRERLASAIQWTGLNGMENRLIQSLSGGEKQKVALAAMLALGARVLVCDEATTMLDPPARIMLKECLRALNRQRSAIVIEMTSLLSDALDADKIVLLEKGKVRFQGTPAAFLAAPCGRQWLSASGGVLGLLRELDECGVDGAIERWNPPMACSFIQNLLNG
ncbi:MAG: energy-coupling factor ABC transporter ATP-binding protein [Desulfomonilaceae bacterium]